MDNYTTCITNIYNEEYLLPFWLNHHKHIFDRIIIIDHHSTDNSLKICKEIIPGCIIIPHPSKKFASKEHDIYLMELENAVKGIKIILNTTEFLFCKTNFLNSLKLFISFLSSEGNLAANILKFSLEHRALTEPTSVRSAASALNIDAPIISFSPDTTTN